jgi:hypothetical protein
MRSPHDGQAQPSTANTRFKSSAQSPYALIGFFLRQHGFTLLLASLFALLVRPGPMWLRALLPVSLVWLVAAWCKGGADANYALEPLAFLAFTIGATLRTIERAGDRTALGLAGAMIAAAMLQTWVARAFGFEPGDPVRQWEVQVLDDFVGGSPGDVLEEVPYHAIRTGRPVLVTDLFQLACIARQGEFSFEPILEGLRSGRITRVTAGYRVYAVPGLREVLDNHFELVGRTQAWHWGGPLEAWQYRPRE